VSLYHGLCFGEQAHEPLMSFQPEAKEQNTPDIQSISTMEKFRDFVAEERIL
jgi:hypothetical protein